MTIFTKIGADAAASAQATKEDKVSAHVKFNGTGKDGSPGTTLKIRIKSANDIAEYFAHGLFNPSVKTFAPEVTPTRNAKGYITANPSVWDRASQLLYDQADAEKDETKAKALRDEAYDLKSKPRYLFGFVNLENGEEAFVDLTKNQADIVTAAIKKSATKIGKYAFELSKSGTSTKTVVTLTLIPEMEEDLTEKERANFAKDSGPSFDFGKFEDFVYMADEEEQTRNLVIAGFDIARLGLSIGANAQPNVSDEDTAPPISDEDAPPAVNF